MKRRMKMNKRITIGMLIFVLACGLMTGCGMSSDKSMQTESVVTNDYGLNSYSSQGVLESEEKMDEESYYEEEMENASAEVEESGSGAGSKADASVNKNTNTSAQKIIKRYDYHYETEQFDDAYAYLKDQIAAYHGYVSSSNVKGAGRRTSGYRTLYLTARIPAEEIDAFISEMGQLGTVVSQMESAEDVTLQYSDTESRIESLKTEQKSLNQLLEQADSLETIIALQDRLTEVRYELENYESKKKLYDDLISYSTVDITLDEVKYTVEVDDSTFFTRIATGLQQSFRDVGAGLLSFIEWCIINIPYFIIWAIVIFILVKVIRIIRKRKSEKKKQKAQEKKQNVKAESVKNHNKETEQK